jgi:hypothetical protein
MLLVGRVGPTIATCRIHNIGEHWHDRRAQPRLQLDPFDCLLLRDLGRQLPGKPKYTTLRDWCERGRVNWATRKRVKVQSIQLPGGEASSLAAYLAFIAKLNEGR